MCWWFWCEPSLLFIPGVIFFMQSVTLLSVLAVGRALRSAVQARCQTDSDGEPAGRHGVEVWR